ncbi:sel1 repeat family protein [Flavobacterium sp. CYK-55]|uniref:tetratricopeptide repeat protein n=1 Tax=Flavobacterium sp. CYK-55 TaxID=2835529 RepID=UPI001BD05B6B|nr:SEL1-like repeat protein [Flavobacterium sp. CYK-55]MBS7787989.1 sel1 repeat family protein [Flavobacterium sp. CYK-55]
MRQFFFSVLRIGFLLSSFACFSQVEFDLSGTWTGKIHDNTINFTIKYDVDLELEKFGNNNYIGFLKIERKLSPLLKVQGNLGNPKMPKHNFIGTFLVQGFVDKNQLNLSITKTLSNNDSQITWCEIKPNFKIDEGANEMVGTYQGCNFAFGTHVILQGGRIELSKESANISVESSQMFAGYKDAKFNYGDFYISSKNNVNEFKKLKFDQENLVRFQIENINTIEKRLNARYEFSLPTDKSNFKTFSYEGIYPLTLRPGQKEYIGFNYQFPFNVYADSINVEVSIIDIEMGNEIVEKINRKLPIEQFFEGPILIKPSGHDTFINHLFMFKKGQSVKDIIEGQVKNKDSLAYAWRGVLMATGRGGYDKNDQQGLKINTWTIKKYNQLAREGNAEIAYVLAMAKLLSGDDEQIFQGQSILRACAEAQYTPAFFDYLTLQLQLVDENQKKSAVTKLSQLFSQGYKRAALVLGDYFSNGKSTQPDKQKALEWYQKVGVEAGAEYYEGLARYYIDFKQTDTDVTMAELNLNKASELGKYNAYNYVAGKLLLTDHYKEASVKKGLALLKIAADHGIRESMYQLGSILIDGSYLGPKWADIVTANVYLKRAAKKDHSKAMIQLAKMYYSGLAGEKSLIKYRYWLTKAGNLGEKVDKSGKLINSFSINNFFSNLDFSPRREIVVTNQYGAEVERYTEGPSPLELGFDSIMQTYAQSRIQKQEFINGIEFIDRVDNQDIYAGTVSSSAQTNLHVKEDQILEFKAQGLMNFGMMAGNRTPDGLPEGLAKTGLFNDISKYSDNFKSYNIETDYPHGAFLIRIADSGWFMIGSQNTVKVPFDGYITIAVNDIDYVNNSGYYDFEIKVGSSQED